VKEVESPDSSAVRKIHQRQKKKDMKTVSEGETEDVSQQERPQQDNVAFTVHALIICEGAEREPQAPDQPVIEREPRVA